MAKIITCKSGDRLQRVSRWISINSNGDGRFYFRFQGRRYYLEEVLRCGSAWIPACYMWDDDDGKLGYISGLIDVNWNRALLIEFDYDAERVRVYEHAD